MTVRGIKDQLLATFATCSALLSSEFHVGWTSPSLIKLQAKDSDLPVTSDPGSWIVSTYMFGSVFGSMIPGILVNKWGTRASLLSSAIPYSIACILIGVAQNYWWLIIAREHMAYHVSRARECS